MWNKEGPLRHKRNLGQISILIVFSLIPLFTLFAFVVNLGMLVNAKISLQNAADLAAYAGAATQARQLTEISHINYQMREAYKKFLYKLYVIGNLSLKCFPRGDAQDSLCVKLPDNASFNWINPKNPNLQTCKVTPGSPPVPDFPKVPAVCVTLSRDSNDCQLGCPTPKVEAPTCFPLDPTCSALQNAAQAIQEIQTQSCKASTVINLEILTHWLYATDIESDLNTNPALSGLIQDVGLIVEEMIHRSRIDTLASYINERPKTSVKRNDIAPLQRVLDEAIAERTILAFKTAYFNLNENVFNQDSIEMTELLPETPTLILEKIQPPFQVAYVVKDGNDPNDPKSCQMKLEYLNASPILGVYKRKIPEVFYAIKLTAKARILFNPFPFGHPENEIDLTAYAAAQPFGSRIGPEITPTQAMQMFTKTVPGPDGNPFTYPVLQMDDVDPTSMDQMRVLHAFHNILAKDVQGAITKDSFDRGSQAAMIPDNIEIGQYNIPVDNEASLGASRRITPSYFQKTNSITGPTATEYTFWAPIIPLDQPPIAFLEKIKSELENVAKSSTGTTSKNPRDDARVKLRDLLASKIDHYVNTTLKSKQNFNVARLVDPFSKFLFGNTGGVSIPGKVMDNNDARRRLATSFTTDHDKDYYSVGREGYSVKLIPIRSILDKPGIPPNVQADLQKIAH